MGRRERGSPPGHAIDEGQAAPLHRQGVAGLCPMGLDGNICVCCKGMAGHCAGTHKTQPRVKPAFADLNGWEKMPHYNVNLSK